MFAILTARGLQLVVHTVLIGDFDSLCFWTQKSPTQLALPTVFLKSEIRKTWTYSWKLRKDVISIFVLTNPFISSFAYQEITRHAIRAEVFLLVSPSSLNLPGLMRAVDPCFFVPKCLCLFFREYQDFSVRAYRGHNVQRDPCDLSPVPAAAPDAYTTAPLPVVLAARREAPQACPLAVSGLFSRDFVSNLFVGLLKSPRDIMFTKQSAQLSL
jgi:hypothetical protein